MKNICAVRKDQETALLGCLSAFRDSLNDSKPLVIIGAGICGPLYPVRAIYYGYKKKITTKVAIVE